MSDLHRFELDEIYERRLGRARENFIADHGLEIHPAIVWQCTAADCLKIDFASGRFAAVIEDGASDVSAARGGWWCGYGAGQRVARVFDGFASASPDDAIQRHGWATQFHQDGHLVAGLWSFPEADERQGHAGPLVTALHVEAFVDFGTLSVRLLETAGYAGPVILTATMRNADRFRFANENRSLSTTQLRRKQFCWPVVTAPTPGDIPAVCLDMARQFMSAFGLGLRRQ